jgi:hypothetical protein
VEKLLEDALLTELPADRLCRGVSATTPHLSTTQLYVPAPIKDMITAVLAHHQRRATSPTRPVSEARDGLSYRPESLEVLFGRTSQ